ncbi:DUF2510 domain-containing protein [Microbacteriaceae bacterium VKM Ac-2854]|nr:DUF2510 domain-containing protein [Microbacteriaceae bacterium VKM Ac-2854]
MSDVNGNTPRAGWYPDPAGSTQQRWWNGTGWTDSLRDAPAAPVPPVEPIAPVAPAAAAAAPATPPAEPATPAAAPYRPAFGEMHPGAPAPQPPYGAPGYSPNAPAAPAYNPAPAYSGPGVGAPQKDPSIRTNTVWIWLIIGLPLLSLFSIFAFDPNEFAREVAAASSTGSTSYSGMGMMANPVYGLVQLLGFAITAATILFGFFDYRALKAAGLQRPFHWAWGFFALIVGPIVYVIGRSVVVKRVTGGGLLPLWVFIGTVVVQIIVGLVWAAQLINAIIEVMPSIQGM